jgi:hypothetical protein
VQGLIDLKYSETFNWMQIVCPVSIVKKYDKQDQQGMNATSTRTSGKEPGGPQTKTTLM